MRDSLVQIFRVGDFRSLKQSVEFTITFLRATLFFASCLIWLPPLCAYAEILPIKTYTSADGLIYEGVYTSFQDSRGFVWFTTPVGVSRFDGYRFTNYTMEDGLTNPLIQNIVEDNNGVYWLGASAGSNLTNGGVYRFDSRVKLTHDTSGRVVEKMFVHYKIGSESGAQDIFNLFKDRRGQVFVATSEGLFLLNDSEPERKFSRITLDVSGAKSEEYSVFALAEDADGSLWVGHDYGLTRRLPDGTTVSYEIESNGEKPGVRTISVDRQNRIWFVTEKRGLINFHPELIGSLNTADRTKRKLRIQTDSTTEPPPGFARRFDVLEKLSGEAFFPIYCASDNKVWIGTRNAGLIEFVGGEFRFYTKENGLSDSQINDIREDVFGNLWVASNWGAMKITKQGFVSYKTVDGLADERIIGIFTGSDQAVYAINTNWRINRFDGRRFVTATPNLPAEVGAWDSHRVMRDHSGEWWIGTPKGVFRFPAVEEFGQLRDNRPLENLTKENGLPSENIAGIFEDSRGNMWLSYWDNAAKGHLTRWERATSSLQNFTPSDGIPADCTPWQFNEDAAGNLIVLCRYNSVLVRRGEKFFSYSTEELKAAGVIHRTLLDSKDRLWIATPLNGLIRFDDPVSENPKQTIYTAVDGLSSSHVQYLAEDDWGKIYFVTSRGMDRLDPETKEIKWYTLGDGLPAAGSGAAVRDKDGALWLATRKGVSKFIPEQESPASPPPVFISSLRVAGKQQPIAVLGETEIKDLTLESDGRQMQIDFYGLNLETGENLLYQYRLEGTDDWSVPSASRTANYPNIPPGSYRFEVRTVNSNGSAAGVPASIEFTVLRPVWQRWWFLLGAALLIGVIIYAFYRYRVSRLLELERTRTRIATDLHDDLGSSLSKIAILSEIVNHQVAPIAVKNFEVEKSLTEIAETSREMVDSMSDIVWAINPQRDSLSDLIGRMRNLAGEMTELADIGLRIKLVNLESSDISVGVDLRREIYLIFKETLNNLVKHSQCNWAEIELRIENHEFVFSVTDDGRGFNVSANVSNRNRGGNGLPNMRRRASSLGGTYSVESAFGKGTTVVCKVPLGGKLKNFGLKRFFSK